MQVSVRTNGGGDVIDITDKVRQLIRAAKVESGVVNIFVPGSTAGVTTIEYESGVIQDLKNVLNKLAPVGADYEHHKKWGDHNGDAHIKAAIIGPEITVPIENAELQLGTWQQIVLIDFDERPRQREIFVKILSEY